MVVIMKGEKTHDEEFLDWLKETYPDLFDALENYTSSGVGGTISFMVHKLYMSPKLPNSCPQFLRDARDYITENEEFHSFWLL